jgi:predicted metalloprotease/predicted small secreted protein
VVTTRALVALVLACSLTVAGCGAVDEAKREVKKGVETAKREAKKGIETAKREAKKLGARAEELREKVEKRVNEVLARIEGVFPRADEDTPVPTLRAENKFGTFTTGVMRNVDRYWTVTFTRNDIRRPRVAYRFVARGQRVRSRCSGETANDESAFYCPADDTIYFGESIGRQIYDNIGDFGVAYALAHEYAHNVQQELGWFQAGRRVTTVAPFELQADCMAGTWAYAVYQRGRLDDADVNEAVSTAYAVGDFDVTNPQHHGTPDQRAGAWGDGYRSGDPSDCRRYTS